MKVCNIRLLQEPNKSFIVYNETKPFSKWHHHPEFELVLIRKGKGRRMIGDHVDRFEDNDLVLLGPFTPHEWMCDSSYFGENEDFQGEGLVIQFMPDFLGEKFFEIPENTGLTEILKTSSRGIEIIGSSRDKIIDIMVSMVSQKADKQLYSLFKIFKVLSNLDDYTVLSSPAFIDRFEPDENFPMNKAMEYIMQNFQNQIHLKDLLEITNMSYSAFCSAFKFTYRMTFKEYLLSIRIGYACKLLTESSMNISEIAYECGFENISNFNRQFKHIKGITPSKFQKQIFESRSALYR